MTTRSDKLNRLQIRSACETSWDAMEGSDSRRFCSECQREVFDFAQMTAREIRDRIEVSGGRLCARLTREGGRLVVLPTVQPPSSWSVQRASPLAATLVSAWLSLGATQAQPTAAVAMGPAETADLAARPQRAPEGQESPGPYAALHGQVTFEDGSPVSGAEVVARNTLDAREHFTHTQPDGTFAFDSLPAGLYELEGHHEGLEIEVQSDIVVQPGEAQRGHLVARYDTLLQGELIVTPQRQTQLFDESELVIAAVAGPTTTLEHDHLQDVVMTELRVEELVKGKLSGRSVLYRHGEHTDRSGERLGHLAPGTKVLAFLRNVEEGRDGEPAFEAVDGPAGVKSLSEEARAAHLERLDALARLERRAEKRGEMEPADYLEWLVATTEDPRTRDEAVRELYGALEDLNQLATQKGTTPELAAHDLLAVVDRFRAEGGRLSQRPRPAVLGATLTPKHRERLTAALRATQGMSDSDAVLFQLVRRWDEEAAIDWLARILRARPMLEVAEEIEWLESIADEMENETLGTLVETALDRRQEIEDLWEDDESAAARMRREKELAALRKELRQQFVEALR